MTGKCARAVSLLSDYMNRTDQVKSFLLGWNSTIQFDLRGEDPFTLEFSGDGSARFRQDRSVDPDVMFFCDSDTFFQIVSGRLDQDEAFSKGLIDMKGSIFDSVRFRHAAELTQRNHGTLFTALRALSRFA